MKDLTTYHFLITGASGYIGSALLEKLVSRGAKLTVIGRSIPQNLEKSSVRFFPWSLGSQIPDKVFLGSENCSAVDVVIHLAHQWDIDRSDRFDENYIGSKLLVEAARKNGVKRFIFCSSISAQEDALNQYGRVKYQTEKLLKGRNEVVARIGLVYGGKESGQWNTLNNLVSKNFILPMIGIKKKVQPIRIDEVAIGLIKVAILKNSRQKIFGLASENPVLFGDFLTKLARIHHGRSIILVPVPLSLALVGVKITNKLPFFPQIDKERIMGLKGAPVFETSEGLNEIRLRVNKFEKGLALSSKSHKRAILLEGAALLYYVGKGFVNLSSLRAYAEAIEKNFDNVAAYLPFIFLKYPSLIRFIESGKSIERSFSGLAGRIQVAALIHDAYAPPEKSYVLLEKRLSAMLLLKVVFVSLIEGVVMIMRYLAQRR